MHEMQHKLKKKAILERKIEKNERKKSAGIKIMKKQK